jgi:hypothetical protein
VAADQDVAVKAKGPGKGARAGENGVDDGNRTHDRRSHNQDDGLPNALTNLVFMKQINGLVYGSYCAALPFLAILAASCAASVPSIREWSTTSMADLSL